MPMICSSENLDRFIVRPFVGSDSSSSWRKNPVAGHGVGKWIEFYNPKRPHSSLGGKPPVVVYWLRKEKTKPDQQEQRVA